MPRPIKITAADYERARYAHYHLKDHIRQYKEALAKPTCSKKAARSHRYSILAIKTERKAYEILMAQYDEQNPETKG